VRKEEIYKMNIEVRVESIKTDSLSKFKTFHDFESYGEIHSIADYIFFAKWAEQNKKDIFILGNGSNTLFEKKRIKSLVLRNKIPNEIKCISENENLFEVSSNVMMSEILRFCYENSIDSFYFLSSVPATIGGALAMNAGEGKKINKTIYDFVESIKYIDKDNSIKIIKPIDMSIEYRKTMFTGCQDKFIVSGIFKFPKKDLSGINPIKERILWSKKHQDNIAPNCGSVFKKYDGRILSLLKGFKVGKSQFSRKTSNWINNNSTNTLHILTLIYIAKILHFIIGKKCEVEVIRVK
jgi:UDP-N-acetylmuramate dehydrogenase